MRARILAVLALLGCSLAVIGQSSAPPVVEQRSGAAERPIEPVTAAQAASRRTAAADGELKLVVALFRHGVRAPLEDFGTHAGNYSIEAWPDLEKDWGVGPKGWGDLTPHGQSLVTSLGHYYADHYRVSGFNVFLWADGDKRNIDTAYALRQGFWDGANSNVRVEVRPASYGTDPLFHPFKAYCGTPDSVKLKGIADNINWNAGGWFAHLASQATQLVKVLGCTGAANQKCKPFFQLADKASPWSPLTARESSPIEWKGQKPDVGRFPYSSSASEAFLLEYANGMPPDKVGWGRVPVPPQTRDSWSLHSMLQFHEFYFDQTERQSYLAKIQGSNLIREILDQIKRTLNQPTDGKCPRADAQSQFVGLVGHDTNLASVGSLLNLVWKFNDTRLPDDTRNLPDNDALPTGALVFELRFRDDAYFVRVEYVTQSLQQMRKQSDLDKAFRLQVQNPDCDYRFGPCDIPLEKFKQRVGLAIDKNFLSSCGSGPMPQQICSPASTASPRTKKRKKP